MKKTFFKKGNKFGNWKLVKLLGCGGNAEVWEAANERKEKVAIKILKKFDNNYFYKRFKNEVKIMWKIKNWEGVLPIIDYHIPDNPSKIDPPWYVMPIAIPLKEYIKSKTKEEIVNLFIQLGEHLSKLHQQGIFHRDIKPENLFYYKNIPCFGDFGLADFPEKEPLTKPGKLGPAWTIAPEMRRNPEKADGKLADSYSFAKTLWMFLTKQWLGFEGQYNPDDRTISLKNYCRTILCEPLEELLSQCTSNTPEERPSMAEVVKKLKEWKKLNQDYIKANREKWKFVQKKIFPKGQPERAIWTNIKKIINILNLLSENNLNHTFLPGGGGLDLNGAKNSIEKDCIELNLQGVAYIIKPKCLIFEGFYGYPEWNYFRLETYELDPVSGDQKFKEYGEEPLTEIEPEFYTDYEYGEFNDFNGEPLPDTARQIIRVLRGSFVIFCKTSPYNRIRETYDGRHDKLNSVEFRKHVEDLIKIYSQREKMLNFDKDTQNELEKDKKIKFVKSYKIKEGRKLSFEEYELLNKVIMLAEGIEKEKNVLKKEFNISDIIVFPDILSEKNFFEYLICLKATEEKLKSFLNFLDHNKIILIAAVMYAGRDYLCCKRCQTLEEMIQYFSDFDKDSLIESIIEKAPLAMYLKAGIKAYT